MKRIAQKMKKVKIFPIVCALLLALCLLVSCDIFPIDKTGNPDGGVPEAGADSVGAFNPFDPSSDSGDSGPEEEYDFSVFFGHVKDPIEISRIVVRYEAETGVRIEPIMTDADAADDRFLERHMGASNPPAAFVLSADENGSVDYAVGSGYVDPSVSDVTAEDFSSGTAGGSSNSEYFTGDDSVSAAGIGWRFRGRGLAADRRVLAELIGAPGPDDKAVDAFIEDMRVADDREWSAFLDGLDGYIKDAAATDAAITLNGKEYLFAEGKGRFSSQLNGIFAVSGAYSTFVAERLFYLASITSNTELLTRSRMMATPQAITVTSPVFDTYISALDTYTSRLGGLYAEGVRGDDFTNNRVYSAGYVRSVFAANRAVFMPMDSGEYAEVLNTSATQAEYIAILPIKLPYADNWLSGYLHTADANKSIELSVDSSLCVNANAAPEIKEKAKAFVAWLAADTESSDAMQLCLRGYNVKGARLPFMTKGESGDDNGDGDRPALFGKSIYDSTLRQLLSRPDWKPDVIEGFKGSLADRWHISD
jgi:hypothetical protein